MRSPTMRRPGDNLQQATAYQEGKQAMAAENWPAATDRFDNLYLALQTIWRKLVTTA